MSIETPRPAVFDTDANFEVPFYIPATGPETRPRRTLKHNDSFLVIDVHGDIGASAGSGDGLFYRDTRYLSHLEIRVNGMELLLLGSNLRDDNANLAVDLTNPDMFSKERVIVFKKDTLHINRSVFVWRDTAFQRLALRNHGAGPLSLVLAVTFANDFADVFEVRGMRRPRRGTSSIRLNAPHEVVLSYLGLDGIIRVTSMYFDPAPIQFSRREATYQIALPSHGAIALSVAVRCNPTAPQPVRFLRGLLLARRELRKAALGTAVVETSNALFNNILCRYMADLAMLRTETPQGPYPHAGTPWYSTTFGRDGLITAMQMLWVDPRIARGVLRRLAAFQAQTTDAHSDAEPGKILHEMRSGEMAALGEVPFGLYYGSIDSTPLFVLLAGLYFERTDDTETLEGLWPAIEAALSWIDGPADRDRDGFIEYARANEHGLANQGWKDSFDADGRLADGPIALAEVQAYVFAAKRLAARCAQRLGYFDRMRSLEEEARRLAERFELAFWCILVRGPADVRARAGRRQAAVPRAHVQRRPSVVYRHRAARSRPDRSKGAVGARFLLRVGHPHRLAPRSPIQSDVLPQWLDLAARQRTDGSRLCANRREGRGRPPLQWSFRCRYLHGPASFARIVLRLPSGAGAWTDALPRGLFAAGLGERNPVQLAPSRPRTGTRSDSKRGALAQPAPPEVSQRSDPAEPGCRRLESRHRGSARW